MVHALKEIWRVLVSGGILLDLRTLGGDMPVEIITDQQVYRIGAVDQSVWIPDDVASDQSLARMTRDKWFVQERKTVTGFRRLWDTLEEMKTCVESNAGVFVPEIVLERGRQITSQKNTRIRAYSTLFLARYRKLPL